MSYNVIFNDDDIYGFKEDLIRFFEETRKDVDEGEQILIDETLDKLNKLKPYVLYKCTYNLMGAYMFEKIYEP